MKKFVASLLALLIICTTVGPVIASASEAANAAHTNSESKNWVGTWASAQYYGDPSGSDGGVSSAGTIALTLPNSTLRQMIRTSVGGDQLRFTFSNEYGATAMTINAASAAKANGSNNTSSIDVSTNTAITFNNGSASVVIQPGEFMTSDLIHFPVNALERIAVSTYFGETPTRISSHIGARANSYVEAGINATSNATLSGSTNTHWFALCNVDVKAPEKNKSIVLFGDSITDGYGVTNERYTRWGDVLMNNLQGNPITSHLSVINMGIGTNALLGGTNPLAAKDRFARDVLNQPGVGYVVFLIGVNDLPGSSQTATNMIAAFDTMFKAAANKGIKVYGGTISPRGSTAAQDANRQTVNAWIRQQYAEEKIYGLADFDTLLRNPDNQSALIPSYAADSIHPNATGYSLMGDYVYSLILDDSMEGKDALAALIAKAELLVPADYTPASWAGAQAALNAAKIVMADEEATQDDADAAAVTLQAALDILEESNLKKLKTALTQAKLVSTTDWSEEDKQALKDAIATAQALVDASSTDDEAILAAIAALEAAASAQPIPRYGYVPYGTPELAAGVIDSLWDDAKSLPVDRHLTMANGPASGLGKLLWDDQNLYVLAEITDPVLNNSNSSTYQHDSVEIFVDENNSKASSFGNGMGQYRVSFTNQQSFGNTSYSTGFESWAWTTDTGYVVLAKIPFKYYTPAASKEIGFDLQINDASASGSRQDVVMWYDRSGSSYNNGSGWGTALLLEGDAVPVDKASLNAAIAKASDLTEGDYTAESWAIFANAFAAAKSTAADTAATQEAVDEAVIALQAAVEGLEKAGEPGEEIPVTALKITGSSTVKRNKTAQLTAVITPTNATDKEVTWTSLTPDAATVDENGLITATSQTGFAIIQATAGNDVTAQFTIRVTV
ncbi:sugar-binding protein [Oscillospiraceae bacterium MB08-C2-2]|nr:sugar-binding protein [Oscillospiraceae bacterium MB08-C2-2]